MFTLIRVMNAPSNAVEPMKQYTTTGVSYKAGTVLTLTSGRLTNCTAADKPFFIAGEDAAPDEKKMLTVYPIQPNMLFEAPASGSPPLLKVGEKLNLQVTDGFAVGVGSASASGVVTLLDNRGATRPGDKVTVRFDN